MEHPPSKRFNESERLLGAVITHLDEFMNTIDGITIIRGDGHRDRCKQ